MGATILIVEANPAVRQLIRTGLTRYGLATKEADAGPAAVAALTEDSSDVRAVVVGELVPGLDGVVLAAALNRARPGVGLYFFCGHSVSPELFHAPGVVVFRKPQGFREMCATVAGRRHAPAGQLSTAPAATAASSSSGNV